MDKELIKLEKALKGLKKPFLSQEIKSRMRIDMLARMNDPVFSELKYPSLEKIKDYIRKIAGAKEPSGLFKARIKENVLAFAEKKRQSSDFIWNIARSWQKVLATLMVGIISLGSFTVYISDLPVAKASKKTVFYELYGDVEILRQGQVLKAVKYMELQEGDIVITGETGLAVIRYFDDSVSRLSPFTELIMHRFYQDENVRAKTKVEIELARGRVWNQVVNLVEEQSSFEISVNNVRAKTSGKASFDVMRRDENKAILVSVFENKVDVSASDKRKENKKVIVEGYLVEFGDNEPKEGKISLQSKEDELWVNVNKVEDKNYKMYVDGEKESESRSEAGLLPDDALYSAKKINESAKLLVAADAISRNKIKVDIAIKRLNEASTLLIDGNTERAKTQLDYFLKIIEELSLEIEGSDELNGYIKSAFAEKEKDFSTVLPDGRRYMAKEALRDAKFKLAMTDGERKGVSLSSAKEKVIEAKEMLVDEKQSHAQITLLQAAKEIAIVSSGDYGATVDPDLAKQKQQVLSTVRVLKGAVQENENVDLTVQKIIEVTEEALELSAEDVPESDSAVVLAIDEEIKVQLKEVQE